MFIVLGATGNIGSSLLESLRPVGEKIIAIAHDDQKARSLNDRTLEGVAVDVRDAGALRDVLKRGRRAFLLNPPASPESDTNAEELRTARAIADAVRGSGLEKVVVASTYGAQPGDAIGDLSVLWQFEMMIEATGVPMAVNRGAYYFTNIDMLIDAARDGELPTPFPHDLELPMVSPIDLGKAAATRLVSPTEDVGIQYVEGPQRHTFADVAAILSDALNRRVSLKQIPCDAIGTSYRRQGFSEAAATAFTNMTLATLDGPDLPADPVRGEVTLQQHVGSLVRR